jgi:L-alanine-DL-glutamate epimerase-like enolase superfamily enzyme
MEVMDRPAPIEKLSAAAYTIPTDFPEADGTLSWDSTTIVVAKVRAAGEAGLGYTYTDKAAGGLIRDKLCDVVIGMDAMAIPQAWQRMVEAVRNIGRPGLCSMAIAAVDAAL